MHIVVKMPFGRDGHSHWGSAFDSVNSKGLLMPPELKVSVTEVATLKH